MHGGVAFKSALVLAACVAAASLAFAAEGVQGQPPAAPDSKKVFHDLVTGRCEKCHNSEDWAGGLAMDTLDLEQVGQSPEVWEKAIAKLRSRLMPLPDSRNPTKPLSMPPSIISKPPSIVRRKPARSATCRSNG